MTMVEAESTYMLTPFSLWTLYPQYFLIVTLTRGKKTLTPLIYFSSVLLTLKLCSFQHQLGLEVALRAIKFCLCSFLVILFLLNNA